MNARGVLPVVAVFLLAGCAGTAAPTATTPATTTTTQADTTTERWLTGVAPSDRLVLEATGNLTATVTQYETNATTNRTANATFHLTSGERVHVDDFTVDGWIVVTIANETAWQGYLGSSNHLELSLHPNGNATVTEHYTK